jgi:DNA polymerase-1
MVFARQAAKSIGFGLNYGEGPVKLGKTLGVGKDEAIRLTQKYFQPYPQVREFIDGVKAFILDHARVETIMGRPRRFHDLPEIRRLMQKVSRKGLPGTAKANLAQAERQSVNSVIQGSAADVAKMAMIKSEFDPRLEALGAQMLLQIHDELIFEVPEESVQAALPLIKENMEHPFESELEVPLDVEAGVGHSWASAKA